MLKENNKLYIYLDETGQDARSKIFIVVSTVHDQVSNNLDESILEIEKLTGMGNKKWHSTKFLTKETFLKTAVNKKLCKGDIFFKVFKKPVIFMSAIETVIIKSIATKVLPKGCKTIVYVDGIDRKKPQELTKAIRIQNNPN